MNNKYQAPSIWVENVNLSYCILTESTDGSLVDMPGEVIFDDIY